VQSHPAFFWIWAMLIATSVIRLDSSLFSIAAILSVLATVRVAPNSSFRRSAFRLAFRLATIAVFIRISVAILIGVPMSGKTLFVIPQIELPDFLVGIRLGGEVTSQRINGALNEALIFAALILLFGAANSLTTPTKILKAIPQRLYGVGVATALAAKLTPQFADSVSRIKQAQFLRGQPAKGFRSWRRMGTPVLEETMSRSLDLAAALEARGYGLKRETTRYKAEPWSSAETIALLPAIYAATLLPSLSIAFFLIALILFFAALAPAVLR
jgi:energy-coupling factor transport system permease protein